MKKKLTALLLVLAMVMSLAAGCGSGPEPEGGTKVVTDCAGREVEIPEDPQRVACLYASTAHMMAMLDQQEKIAGVPGGVRTDVLMQMKYPEIEDLPVPFQEGSVNAEELMRIEADLILVRRSTADDPGEAEKLEDTGIPYAVVDYESVDELEEAILVTGRIFDREDKARRYVEFSRKTMDDVEERLEGLPEEGRPRVFHSVSEAIRTDGKGDICQEIMERAGIRNVAADEGLASAGKDTYATLEEIYEWEPDAFIVNEYEVARYMKEDPKWAGLDAVKAGRVEVLPVGATRWCHPGSMEAHMGVLFLASSFYGDRFEDLDLKEFTRDYYEEFFGLDLDDDTLDNIMSGRGMRRAASRM